MTISASYNLLPDFSRNFQPDRSVQPTILSRTRTNLSLETDAHSSSRQAGTYKFYVMTDATDTVYTRQKQTEKLFTQEKGTLVNLYV